MSVWNVIGKVLGFVPAVVKLVRENTRSGKGTGHYYQAVKWDDEGRTLMRSPYCFYCKQVNYKRAIHTEPPCPGKEMPK